MESKLKGTTAIVDGVMGVPSSEPGSTSPASPVAVGSNLPPNEPNGDLAITSPNSATTLTPDSTGPPNTNDYWFALILEKTAAEYLGLTVRWMQSKRQNGGGPKFVSISQRCIRYRRLDLKAYADQQLRSSTSDRGAAA